MYCESAISSPTKLADDTVRFSFCFGNKSSVYLEDFWTLLSSGNKGALSLLELGFRGVRIVDIANVLGQNLGRHWRSMKREEEEEEEEDSGHRTRKKEMDPSKDPRNKADGKLICCCKI
ncbi:hypothetical protein B296_00035175 [Ensete ventricosum]|uniref:Uncharacterized protein n=1 Tax=Ensete ventricosum TaxID=4639 RepID=A0A426Y4Q0_ENSVE|nr:hypothetical protein B296_00035175 [Ensete ventricosum]